MSLSDDKKYSIQFVSKLTGLNAHTIRAWEKRYKAIVPSRNEAGKRVFNSSEVSRLQLLSKLVNLGNTISDIANLSFSKLQELASEFEISEENLHQLPSKKELSSDKRFKALSQNEIDLILQALIRGLKNYKLDIISHELDKLKKIIGPRDFALKILSPLLREVGRLVNQAQLSIAQEHSLSAILRFHIGQILYTSYQEKNLDDTMFVFATPEGDMHEFGIMMGALLCAYHNKSFIYLGSNMPADSLVQACNQIKAKVLILGVTFNFADTSGHQLTHFIDEIAQNLNENIQLWIGGGPQKVSFTAAVRTRLIPSLEELDSLLSSISFKV